MYGSGRSKEIFTLLPNDKKITCNFWVYFLSSVILVGVRAFFAPRDADAITAPKPEFFDTACHMIIGAIRFLVGWRIGRAPKLSYYKVCLVGTFTYVFLYANSLIVYQAMTGGRVFNHIEIGDVVLLIIACAVGINFFAFIIWAISYPFQYLAYKLSRKTLA